MVAKDSYQRARGSTKAEVGEIDTSAPFQSVKDAVSLFGEGAFSGEKPTIKRAKPQSAEKVFARETQLHSVQKDLNRFKEELKNAETSRIRSLSELERAKETVEDLTQKLKSINESKDYASKAADESRHLVKQLSGDLKGTDESSNMDLENARIQYISLVAEVDVAKLELRKIRREYDASVDSKETASKLLDEAESAMKLNLVKVDELSKEFAFVQDSIQQVVHARTLTREEEKKIFDDKDAQKQLYKARHEEARKKLLVLKEDLEFEKTKNLETQLSETLSEIETLQNKMFSTKSTDLDSVRIVTSGLDGAKESLHKVVEEENSLRSLVETLKLELNIIKKEHSELKEKEAETESIASNLHMKLQKAKLELEEALVEEAKVRGASDEMIATIQQIALERENAKIESEESKQHLEELKREAETTRIDLEEANKKLRVATQEAEEAKAAEATALGQIKLLSEKTDAARVSTSEPGAQITISTEEFESLSLKVSESEKLSEMKVAAAMAQVEAVKASENEALKKLETAQKEIEDMKAATEEAIKKAETAEAAKKAIEGELRRRREREQKKAAELASRILSETEKSFEPSPRIHETQKKNPQDKALETRKLEKAKTNVTKKTLLPNLSGVFQKKKYQVESGSPSYLPGEKPVW